MNKFSKALKRISGKRAKTDADFEELSKIEWYASLYTHDGKLCIPSEVIEATLANSARKMKLGKQAQTTIFVPSNAVLKFDGDNLTIDQLWERGQNIFTTGVRIQKSRIMRTRARIDDWSSEIEVVFDDTILDPTQVKDIVARAGREVGLCDWRPRFGRFNVV